ncbi:MAG: murein biosynthesis integral membrane protein MurJ [Planctomycetota bacterium]|nr:murein biosynthesis integral membrane protein MurJ [Planctomycetota bacterium]
MSIQDAPAPPRGADVVGRHTKLVRRTALVSGLTLASRILGYVRESLAAAVFGDKSAINDAFVTAWRVPNLFRSLMGEGAMATAMQSALTRTDAEQGEEAGRRLFLGILRTVAWLSAGFCALGILIVLAMPDTMPGTGWAWLGADPGPVRELTARMLPFVVFACVAAVAGGALHVRGHFLAPSLGPVVMNVAWVGALLWVATSHVSDLAGGAPGFDVQYGMARELATLVLVCGVLLVLVQAPALRAKGLLAPSAGAPPGAKVHAREVWSILRSSAPLAIGAAVYQVNVLVDGLMAESLLANGGPSALYYATRLQQLPLSLVSIAATSAVFPALTAFGHVRDLVALRKLHDETHMAIAFLAIPATIGLLVFAEPIVAACFQHGAFGEEGVARTAAGLRALTLAILPAGAAGLVARTRYALGDFAGPVRIAVAMLVLNTVLNLVFVAGLGLDVGGLGLATALCSWGNLALLLPGLRRLGAPPAAPGLGARLARTTLVAGAACAAGWLLTNFLIGPAHPLFGLAAGIACATGSYIFAMALLRAPELARFREHFRGLPS